MQGSYRFRFQRPGSSPDRDRLWAMRWAVGVGIPIVVILAIAASSRSVSAALAATTVFILGVVCTSAALLLGAALPRIARLLSVALAALGFLLSLAIVAIPDDTSAWPLLAMMYFLGTLALIAVHWELLGTDRPFRAHVGQRFRSGYKRLRADELPDDPVIRRIRLRVHRRRRRGARPV